MKGSESPGSCYQDEAVILSATSSISAAPSIVSTTWALVRVGLFSQIDDWAAGEQRWDLTCSMLPQRAIFISRITDNFFPRYDAVIILSLHQIPAMLLSRKSAGVTNNIRDSSISICRYMAARHHARCQCCVSRVSDHRPPFTSLVTPLCYKSKFPP